MTNFREKAYLIWEIACIYSNTFKNKLRIIASITTIFCIVFMTSCGQNDKNENVTLNPTNTPEESQIKTITSFDELEVGEEAYFVSPNGEKYLVTLTPGADEMDEKSRKSEPFDTNKPCEAEEFDGSQRGEAKISISTAPIERFSNLSDFLRKLPSDQEMVSKVGRNKNRITEEKRNVTVDAWLYTFSRQSDEDYHLIIGTSNNKETASFINVEISGLPSKTTPSYEILDKARLQFKNYMKDFQRCRGGYVGEFINKPVFVRITGSLFFDSHHYTPNYSNIGHKNLKPKTYWEIHPITNIEFP